MSILIKGIEMPTHDYIDIRIFPHGKAEINKIRTATRVNGTPAFYKTLDVVELPPHGDLIDRDAFMTVTEMVNGEWKEYFEVFEIDGAPIIIEAEDK